MKETESGERHIVLKHATKDDQTGSVPYAIIPYSVFTSLSAEEVDLAGQDIAAMPFVHNPSRFEDSNVAGDQGCERVFRLAIYLNAFVFIHC
jgi:hypothetical protein